MTSTRALPSWPSKGVTKSEKDSAKKTKGTRFMASKVWEMCPQSMKSAADDATVAALWGQRAHDHSTKNRRCHFRTEFSAGGGVSLDVRRWGQSFSLGLAWYDYVHLLDYVETTTQDYLDPEGIQAIEINALTGDTVAILYGDVQGLATQRRHVRSFNRFNAVVIPIEWRTSRSHGRWHGGLGLGVQLLVRSGGRGHSLNEEGLVVAYTDGDLPKSRLNWTPTGGLFAGYQVAPEWRLVRPCYGKSGA